MSGCHCEDQVFDGMSGGYRRVLWTVIAINASMFLVELTAGITANSMSLQADALDFLGDSATYFISLLVIGRPQPIRSKAALFKGASLAVLAVWVLGSTIYRVFILEQPDQLVMGWVGAAALVANLASVLLLLKYRDGDANVRSVWLCSRNDAIGNVAVICAAVLVGQLASAWPDLIVALVMASLFLTSSVKICRQAMAELKTQTAE
ncbi:MAG: cation transporter [Alphaproteobacteria bacterium]|nr:MAG: cation transporter [Alphaproteobacteria bacterium]